MCASKHWSANWLDEVRSGNIAAGGVERCERYWLLFVCSSFCSQGDFHSIANPSRLRLLRPGMLLQILKNRHQL